MKNKRKNLAKNGLLIAASAAMVVPMFMSYQNVEAASASKLSDKNVGDIVKISGKEFYVVAQGVEGTKLMDVEYITGSYTDNRGDTLPYLQFDATSDALYNPNDTDNLAYKLNNEYYNNLPKELKDLMVKNATWNIGDELNESAKTVKANVGLLTRSESNNVFINNNGKVDYLKNTVNLYEYTLTPTSQWPNRVFLVMDVDYYAYVETSHGVEIAARPVIVLKPDLYVDENGGVTTVPPAPTTPPSIDTTDEATPGLAGNDNVSTNSGAGKDVKALLRLAEGDFSLQTKDITSFGKVKLTAEKQILKTNFADDFKVIDARGTQQGWKVNVSATPFKEETFKGFVGTPTQLPLGTLSVNKVHEIQQVGFVHESKLPTPFTNDFTIIDSGEVTVLNADRGNGMGEFDFNFGKDALSMVVDSTTAKIDRVNYPDGVTPYASTITWNLITGP